MMKKLILLALFSFVFLYASKETPTNPKISTSIAAVGTDMADSSTSLFVFLKQFPLTAVTSFIGIFMVSVFFVTSSDSGSLVIDSITSGGKLNAPVGQRILWAFMEGAVAIALLVGGGLKTMQAASISTGILFLIVLFIMCWSLVKSLGRGHKKRLKKFKQKHPNAWVESDA